MNQTWRMLTLTLGLAVLASSQLRAEDSHPPVPVIEKSCCSGSTCGRNGPDIWGWLTYCPKGRQMCTECSCLSRHGQRTPPLFAFFLDYPCPPYAEQGIDGRGLHGHLHYVKHACKNCGGNSTGAIEEVKMLPADAPKMPAAAAKKMPVGASK
jgi:hypothetical protein